MAEAVPQAAAPAAPPPPAATPAAPAAVAAPVAAPAAAAAAPVVPPPAAVAPVAAPVAEPGKKSDEAAAAPTDKKPDAGAKPAADPAKPAETEATADFEKLALPEGAKYEPEAIGEFKKFAKENGFSLKQAEAVLTLDAQMASKARQAQEKARADLQKRIDEARTKDVEALKADPTFGGKNYDKTVADAQLAEKRFFGEDGFKLIKEAGLENHPAFVKGMARIRQLVSEDMTNLPPPATAPVEDPRPKSQTERGGDMFKALRTRNAQQQK